MKALTSKQAALFNFIAEWQAHNGHPPTHAEICEQFGFGSLNTVRNHLHLIEKKGYIHLSPGKARGIQVMSLPDKAIRLQEDSIPILGKIAAGMPIWAEQNLEGYLPIPSSIFGGGELFALHVVGDSMTGAGINSGDIAVIKRADYVENGEIAAVLVEQEATLKRVYSSPAALILKAENPAYKDQSFNLDKDEYVRILGRYQGIVRTQDNRYCP